MIKLLRQGAIERPWFLRIAIFGIAGAFIIGMGWWGFGSSNQLYVAQIDDIQISKKEYRQAYSNAYRIYRNLLSENFDEDILKNIVINDLVERQLWIKISNQMGVTIGTAEITDKITRDRSFYRKGQFDPEQYRWVLSNARPPMTPKEYESALSEDLLVDKIKSVLRDGIILTENEMRDAKATITDPALSDKKRSEAEDQAIQNTLNLKRQRVVLSYLESVHSKSIIEIQDWLL